MIVTLFAKSSTFILAHVPLNSSLSCTVIISVREADRPPLVSCRLDRPLSSQIDTLCYALPFGLLLTRTSTRTVR
jgi:hypothetical protein